MASRCSRSPRPGCTSRRTSADVPLPTARLDSQSRLYFLFTCIRAWIHVPDEKASQNRPKSWAFRGTTHYHGHRERLRDRFREAGAESVNDYELLELVLFRAIPQRDVKPLAKDLIARFGSFPEVISAPAGRLAETKSLGEGGHQCC